jgi:SAM-dependent methyltransferase
LPAALFDRLYDEKLFSGRGDADDIGEKYKRAEMAISTKVDDPSFFGPGYLSPFNPGDSDHTVYLIRLFSFCLRLLLRNGPNQLVLDAGCGYSWTTEWLLKIGFEPIGVDITRTYLDIAVSRMGRWSPHLVLADTEHLPIRSSAVDAVLCFEAFHHIPDRKKAMQQFFRILRAGKTVILAEPGSYHDNAPTSIHAMEKYGILEHGMDLADLSDYVSGSEFLQPAEHFVLEIDAPTAAQASLTDEFLRQHHSAVANLFTIDKPKETGAVPQRTTKERVMSAIRGMGLLPK